jgi:E3 ubiquitin-protein ligase HUWE1
MTASSLVAIGKLTLEKNVVPLLISAANSVDVNYPFAKTILNSIMRPVEHLTKIAATTKEKQKPGSTNQNVNAECNQADLLMDVDPALEEEINDEVDRLYHRSSLFIFGETIMNEDTDGNSIDALK